MIIFKRITKPWPLKTAFIYFSVEDRVFDHTSGRHGHHLDLEHIDRIPLEYEEEHPPRDKEYRDLMKRTQSSNLICEICHQGIRAHQGPGAGFSETINIINGMPVKRWYHIKRCWPIERNRRKKEKRLAEREKTPPAEPVSEEPTPVAEAPARKTKFAGQRGLGHKLYEMLDAIPIGKEWNAKEMQERLKVHGYETTYGTVQQFSWTYRQYRREAVLVRRTTTGGKIWKFEIPAPTSPITLVAQHQHERAAVKRKQQEVKPEPPAPRPEPPQQQVVKQEPAPPKPKPSGLTPADVNRMFADLQAFLLEALLDFRNEVLKKLK